MNASTCPHFRDRVAVKLESYSPVCNFYPDICDHRYFDNPSLSISLFKPGVRALHLILTLLPVIIRYNDGLTGHTSQHATRLPGNLTAVDGIMIIAYVQLALWPQCGGSAPTVLI